MSAINPASYTIMNPSNAVRPSSSSRAPQSNYVDFLKQQEAAGSPQPEYLASRMGEMSLNSSAPQLRGVGSSELLAAASPRAQQAGAHFTDGKLKSL